MHVLHIFLGCHKQNSLPLGPIQPSPPSTKEFHELSINSRRVSHPVNNQFIVTRFTSVCALVLDPISSFYVYSFICTYLPICATYIATRLVGWVCFLVPILDNSDCQGCRKNGLNDLLQNLQQTGFDPESTDQDPVS